MIVAFDTCVLVWGIQGKATSRQVEPKIIIPTPVIFELLLNVHSERHGVTLTVKS